MSTRPRFSKVDWHLNAWYNLEAPQTRPVRCFRSNARTKNSKNGEKNQNILGRRELCTSEIRENQNRTCRAPTPLMTMIKLQKYTSLATRIEMRESNSHTSDSRRNGVKEGQVEKLLFSNGAASLSKSETEIQSVKLSRYPKFIPVEDMELKLYPKCEMDVAFPHCWLDVQTWFQQCHRCNSHRMNTILYQTTRSKSESAISSIEKNVDKLNVYPDGSDPLSVPGKEVANHPRFGVKNSTYCTMASKLEWSGRHRPPLELFIEILADGTPFSKLSQMKTEMILKCLQSFFFPCGDAMIHCVESIKPYIQMATGVSPGTDLFGREITRENLKHPTKAILFLSGVPATLLKHENLCVLDTLSFSIGISKESLLVLPMVKLQTVEIVNEYLCK